MAVKFNIGNASIELKEMTEECLENLLNDSMMSLFLPFDSPDIIRKRFKEAQQTGDWEEVEDKQNENSSKSK